MRLISLLFITFFSLASTVNAQEYSTTSGDIVTVTIPSDVTLLNVSIRNGAEFKIGDKISEGDFIALIVDKSHNKITVTSGVTGEINKEYDFDDSSEMKKYFHLYIKSYLT